MTRLLLVDDHELVRDGLRTLLHQRTEMRVVAEAADTRAALAAAEAQPFDMAIVDVRLAGASGVALVRELRRRKFVQPMLMLSMFDELEIVAEALRAGATGYATKDAPWNELEEALQRVAEGQRYVPPRLAPRLSHGQPGLLAQLSPREGEVFDLLVNCHSNAQIARALFISEKTVETHRTRIFAKLGVTSLAALVRLAARHNLLVDQGSLAAVTPGGNS